MIGSVTRKECGAGLVAGYLILCRYHTTKGKLEDGKVMPENATTLDRPLPGIHTPTHFLPFKPLFFDNLTKVEEE